MKNTCERAFDVLSERRAAFRRSAISLGLRCVAPSGKGRLSDGRRILTVAPCERFRFLCIHAGFETIAEIDQRDYHERPHAMASAAYDLIAAAGYTIED
jgi:hypothetical protein